MEQVSTESSGVVSAAGSTRGRPSSRARRSGLKNLLTKGYRCLALLEGVGPQPLLRAAAEVVRKGGGGGKNGERGGGRGLQWRGGRLVLDGGLRKRLVEFDPFHEVICIIYIRIRSILLRVYRFISAGGGGGFYDKEAGGRGGLALFLRLFCYCTSRIVCPWVPVHGTYQFQFWTSHSTFFFGWLISWLVYLFIY